MPDQKLNMRRAFTMAARAAAKAARDAKRTSPDPFGEPELFVIRADGKKFTWELRRFGGIRLMRGDIAFAHRSDAEAAGTEALRTLIATGDVPRVKRQQMAKAAVP